MPKKAEAPFTPHISIACSGSAKQAGEDLYAALEAAWLAVTPTEPVPPFTAGNIILLLHRLTDAARRAP